MEKYFVWHIQKHLNTSALLIFEIDEFESDKWYSRTQRPMRIAHCILMTHSGDLKKPRTNVEAFFFCGHTLPSSFNVLRIKNQIEKNPFFVSFK